MEMNAIKMFIKGLENSLDIGINTVTFSESYIDEFVLSNLLNENEYEIVTAKESTIVTILSDDSINKIIKYLRTCLRIKSNIERHVIFDFMEKLNKCTSHYIDIPKNFISTRQIIDTIENIPYAIDSKVVENTLSNRILNYNSMVRIGLMRVFNENRNLFRVLERDLKSYIKSNYLRNIAKDCCGGETIFIPLSIIDEDQLIKIAALSGGTRKYDVIVTTQSDVYAVFNINSRFIKLLSDYLMERYNNSKQELNIIYGCNNQDNLDAIAYAIKMIDEKEEVEKMKKENNYMTNMDWAKLEYKKAIAEGDICNFINYLKICKNSDDVINISVPKIFINSMEIINIIISDDNNIGVNESSIDIKLYGFSTKTIDKLIEHCESVIEKQTIETDSKNIKSLNDLEKSDDFMSLFGTVDFSKLSSYDRFDDIFVLKRDKNKSINIDMEEREMKFIEKIRENRKYEIREEIKNKIIGASYIADSYIFSSDELTESDITTLIKNGFTVKKIHQGYSLISSMSKYSYKVIWNIENDKIADDIFSN